VKWIVGQGSLTEHRSPFKCIGFEGKRSRQLGEAEEQIYGWYFIYVACWEMEGIRSAMTLTSLVHPAALGCCDHK